jgi:hypothetical protein
MLWRTSVYTAAETMAARERQRCRSRRRWEGGTHVFKRRKKRDPNDQVEQETAEGNPEEVRHNDAEYQAERAGDHLMGGIRAVRDPGL